MKISVALATYNGEKYIKELLVSLLSQTRKADEVIISDDNSSDKTVECIKGFIKDNNIQNWKIIENKENVGFKKNFKTALENTSGELVLLCDQDDIWENSKIEIFEKEFESNKNILAISSSFCIIDKNGKVTKTDENGDNFGLLCDRVSKNELRQFTLQNVLKSNISPGCTSAYRREIVSAFVKTSVSILAHDWELNLIAALKGGLYFLNIPLIKYRIHGENALGFSGEKYTREEIALQKLNAVCELNKYSDCEKTLSLMTKRYELLKEKKTFGVFGLIFCSEYRKYYSFKEWLGDIKYSL